MQYSIIRTIFANIRKAILVFILVFLNASNISAQDLQQIMPNYRNADIRQIVEAVGEVTGKNFLVDPRVTGSVTLLSYTPMSPEAFYEAFLATLQVHAFVAVETDDLVRIIPDANARMFQSTNPSNAADEMLTQVIKLENISAAQVVPILRPLIPQYGHLAAHPAANLLIIADRAVNVRRMLNIISRMDQNSNADIEVIRLENASASEVATMLTTLNQAATATGLPTATIAADNRTNSILLSGSSNSRLRFRALIAHLDTPTENGGDAHVRYLNYADAEILVANLQTQFATSPGTNGTSSGGATIWADAGTNALIINADARTLQNVNFVIDKLDIRRAQVQVDAIIVEMSESRANEFGVTWAIQGANDEPLALTNFPSTAPGVAQLGAAAAAAGTTSLNPALLPDGILSAVGSINNTGTSWAAVVTALAGDATTNIIGTPTIVTLDNEEAEIHVGQEVPFLTGQFTNTGGAAGAVNPFQTVQRQEIGMRLAITPQINEGSGVKLIIDQETSSLNASVTGAIDLITNTRTITTSVFVEDGHILVLGGLIDEQLRENEQRVPVLGRIPILGGLFRSQSAELVRTNLMVFIRPTILRDSVQAAFETNAKYRYIRDLQLQQNETPLPLMRDQTRPTLPELPEIQPQNSETSPVE
jgi:general secretion pathway protein D